MQATLPILDWCDVFDEIGKRYPHIAGDVFLLWHSTRRDIPSCILTASLDHKAGRIDGKRVNVRLYSFDENIDSSANVDDFDVIDNDSADILDTLVQDDKQTAIARIIAEFGDASNHKLVAEQLATGKTHEETAELLGISRSYVSKIVGEIRESI